MMKLNTRILLASIGSLGLIPHPCQGLDILCPILNFLGIIQPGCTVAPPPPAPIPKICAAVSILPGIACGECRDTNVNTFCNPFVSMSNCFKITYRQCGAAITTGDCADATANCFGQVCGLNSLTSTRQTSLCWQYQFTNPTYCANRDAPQRPPSWLPRNITGHAGQHRHLDETTILYDEQDDDNKDDTADDKPLAKDQTFLGFVRIPKTGSTTLLQFLRRAKRMHTWDKHLPISKEVVSNKEDKQKEEEEKEELENSSLPPTENAAKKAAAANNAAGCIYGYASTKRHLAGYYSPKTFWNGCPHLQYSDITEHWAKSLPNWSPPLTITSAANDDEEEQQEEPFTLTLNAMTMVRDPFDRLVSYFYYLRKFTETNEFLKHTATEAQYERVKANDLDGWMELLHIENGGCGLLLPYQYKYIHQDIDEAMALIQEEDENTSSRPGVLPLVTECYEASLHLVTNKFAGYFEPDYVTEFMQSDEYMTNKNEGSHVVKPSKQSLLDLRGKAEVWFADDFKFYDEAVKQFLMRLEKSSLDESVLEMCKLWTQDHQGDAAVASGP